MLIHPIQSTELYPIGSIVEASNPPDNKWVPCNGQVLAQADYPVLYNLMEQPHSIFQNFEVVQDTDLDEMYEVVYGNGLFVGCGDGEMFYSSDGLSWTKVVLPTYTNTFYGIAYDGTTFVSVGYDDGEYVTSTDGQNWTERLLPVTWSVTNITYSGTYFFIIGNTCLRSSNGTSWTESTDSFLYGFPGQTFDTPCGFNYVNSKWVITFYYYTGYFLVFEGSDILDPNDWVPYVMQPFINTYRFNCEKIIYTGNHYIFFNSYMDGALVGPSLHDLTHYRISVREAIDAVNDGEDYVVILTTEGDYKSVGRSEGDFYDLDTEFRLPHQVVADNSRVGYYIKLKDD